MALIECSECGAGISDKAGHCVKCGAPTSLDINQNSHTEDGRKPIGCGKLIGIGLLFIALIVGAILYSATGAYKNAGKAYSSAPQNTVTTSVKECSINSISIKKFNAGFVDSCSQSHCYSMKGVATLVNSCNIPVGIEMKMVSYDKSGSPVSASTMWPSGVENIPPGTFVFSLDMYLDYNPSIASFTLEPTTVTVW